MLQSMTGQGHASGQFQSFSIDVEVRSVNNRFLKLTTRLSETISGVEPQMESIVREYLRRGSVTISVRVSQQQQSRALKVSSETLRSYVDQFQAAIEGRRALDWHWRIELGSVLQLPGVLDTPKLEESKELCDASIEVLRSALKQLNAMRSVEGQSMQRQLGLALDEIVVTCGSIEQRAPQIVDDYRRRLESRVRSGLANVGHSVTDVDLLREVLQFSDRCDICEELVRLTSHVNQFRQSMINEEAPGKRLDFLIQELFREANTIGSKANDATIAHQVVSIKTLIEQMRELIQNVE
jgi:uncharacterized protein (TIGR00255 family)